MLMSLILAATSYGAGEEFYEDGSKGTVKLKESVISGVGYETTVRNTPKNIQIVSSEEIEEKNYQDVTEVLKDSPLVNISENQFGPIVEMRGSGGNSKATVQVLVDGVNINPVDINHGTMPINAVPVSSIEKIEILPGGSSVLYGDGATGGVINIITKAGSGSDPISYVGARYGSNANKEWEAGSGAKIGDNLSVQVNYSGTERDGNRDEESYERDYVEVSSTYNVTENDTLSFKYAHTEEKSTSADLLTRDQLNQDRNQSGIDIIGEASGEDGNGDAADESELTRDEFTAKYEKKITDKLTFKIQGSYQETENDFYAKELNVKNTGGFNYVGYYADWDGTFTDEKVKVSPSIKYDYMDDSYLIVGYDYMNQKTMREFDNYMDMYKEYSLDAEKESHAGYVFNKTTAGKFEFTQGFRREWTSFDMTKKTHYYHQVAPGGGYVDTGLTESGVEKSMRNDAFELAANFLYSDTGNVYLRFEQSFRTPAPTEFQDKVDSEYVINDLDAETNNSVELGFNDYILGSFISANTFFTQVEDEIYYDEIEHGEEWTYSNLDETRKYGVELSTEQYLGKFTFFQNASYIKTEIVADDVNPEVEGNEVPYASRLNANVGTKYSITERLNTILSVNYREGYYLDKANEYEASSNITTDLTVNYAMPSGLRLYAGINNLLDRNNYDRTGVTDGELAYDPADERSFYGGFKYQF